MDWRDLRMALAVGRHGSLRTASKAIGVDPTTISRRVTQLEDDIGSPLFVRRRQQWQPTESGRLLLTRGERIAKEVRSLKHELDHNAKDIGGQVRLSGVDEVLSWLIPHLPRLRDRHPRLQVELQATNANVDLRAGQADVAVRMGRPEPHGLRVRKLASIPVVVACHPLVAVRPPAERPVILIGLLDTDHPENRRLNALPGRVIASATSLSLCMTMVCEGVGVGIVSAAYARTHELTVLEDDLPTRDLWRAVPEELKDAPRIRAITDWLDQVPFTL